MSITAASQFFPRSTRRPISAGLALALLASLLTALLALQAPPAQALERAVLDGLDRAGEFTSLVLDADGNPVVSYYDLTKQDLNVAHCNDPNCQGGDESIETVDSTGQVGRHTSLTLDADGNPVISYYDDTNQALKVVHCNDPNCAGNDETPQTIEDGGVGRYSSIALDGEGNPVVSYHDDTTATLTVAHCNDANCAGADETIRTVDPTPGSGQFTSLQLNQSGNPVISHYDIALGDLRLTVCDDLDCASASTELVDGTGNAGAYSSLELDAEDRPIIAYQFVGITTTLRVAHCDDPSCTEASFGNPNGTVGGGAFIDMALNALGNPVISHYDSLQRDLRVLQCNDPACQGQDESNRSPDWNGDVGLHTSIAIDGDGNVVVSHFDEGNENLRLVTCQSANCGEDEAIRTVNSADGVGLESSLALDQFDNPVIAYHREDPANALVTHCNEPICGGGDESTNTLPGDPQALPEISMDLDSSGNPVVVYRTAGFIFVAHCNDPLCEGGDEALGLPSDSPGTPAGPFNDPSLVVAPDGNPVFTWYEPINDNLVVTRCNDPSCIGNDETFTIVDDSGDVGRGSSLVLDSDGNPVISYQDFNGGLGNVKLVHCNDPVCAGDDDSIQTVDEGDGGFVGGATSLVLDASGNPVISYTDFTRNDLKIAHCNDTNCAGGDESITSPDTSGDVGLDSSIALGPDGNPTISYYDASNQDLVVLHCDDPNCAGGDERPSTVDATGNVGQDTSLELDSAGNPVVSYYDRTNEDLKVVHCNDLACRTNELPVADAGGPYTVASGASVALAGVGSDPDGGDVVYQWDFDDDGLFDDASGAAAQFDASDLDPGTYPVALRVVDDEVNTAVANSTVTVTPAADGPGGPGGPDGPGDPGPQPDPDGVIETAIALSQERFPTPDATTPRHVVLARTLVFADALTGSVLTSDGPLLFTDQATLDSRTDTEIDRLLDPGDTIILLGGPNALSTDIEQALIGDGYQIVRLQGPSRVETAVAIADHALVLYGVENNVAIARADSPVDNPTAAWADSISAGGWAAFNHSPILLTQTTQLHPATAQWLVDHPSPARFILGGTAAVSDTAATSIGTHTRIGGSNRFATAVAIADTLRDPATSYLITSGEHPDGWAYALASAGLSASSNQPHMLVSNTTLPPETDAALCTGPTRAGTTVIGDTSVVSQTIRDQLAGPCPAPRRT